MHTFETDKGCKPARLIGNHQNTPLELPRGYGDHIGKTYRGTGLSWTRAVNIMGEHLWRTEGTMQLSTVAAPV